MRYAVMVATSHRIRVVRTNRIVVKSFRVAGLILAFRTVRFGTVKAKRNFCYCSGS